MKATAFILGILILIIGLNACVKEKFITTDGAALSFSRDTVLFDTVFVSIGSATRYFKVYNPHAERIRIDRIELAGLARDAFRINVDGIPGSLHEGVEIAANDSIYIFVDVTVDPDQPLAVSPFVIHDRLIFHTNGVNQVITLEAWGQNANYIPDRFARGKISLLSCDLSTVKWDDPRPYVLYGALIIDSCTLEIAAGTRIYVHGGIARQYDTSGNVSFYNDGNLIFGSYGRLRSLGTGDRPVIFQGDRLEEDFRQTPGQWNGIRFEPLSRGNLIRNTVIRNSIFGIFSDSATTLELVNTEIYNTSSYGLLSFHVDRIEAVNCLFHSNGAQGLAGLFGGEMSFIYTTFANYGNDSEGVLLTNYYCYDFPLCTNTQTNPLSAEFRNCIMTGSAKDEFWLSLDDDTPADVHLDHCILRIDELMDDQHFPDFEFQYCDKCLIRQRSDSLFADVDSVNFHLDSMSVALDLGVPVPGITIDKEGNDRDADHPDPGCFERSN